MFHHEFPSELNLTYINLIREPLGRFVSQYYYKRVGFAKKPTSDISKVDSINDCIAKHDPVCLKGGTWTLIPYFCGNDNFCQIPTKRALNAAMENVRKSYLLVGILEDYDRFWKLGEVLMPRFFKGAHTLYQSIYTKLRRNSKTAYKAGFY